jgi:hypothetical protein
MPATPGVDNIMMPTWLNFVMVVAALNLATDRTRVTYYSTRSVATPQQEQ